ncbi:MAG: hypothetical protein KJ709_01110 [Nanoarchaeota archaeon]|nr:hypothetical protein [Nanoarchaeota archaeon]
MKKRLLLVLLFLALLPSAFGSVLDKWVYSGDYVQKDGVVYTFQLDATGRQLYINSESEQVMIEINETAYTDYYEYKFAGTKEGKRDYVLNIDIPQLHVIINKREPTITMTLKSSQNNPVMNQEITITGTMKNTGTKDVNNFDYKLAIPTNKFEILSVRYADQDGNIIKMHGGLAVGQDEKFEIRLRAIHQNKSTLVGKMNYTYGSFQKKKDSPNLVITPENSVILSFTTQPEKISVGTQGTLTVKLQNKDQKEKVEITKFNIQVPEDVKTTSVQDLTRKGEYYVAYGTVLPTKTLTYTFKVTPKKTGKHDFPYELEYEYRGRTFKKNGKFTIQGTSQALKPTMRWKLKKNTVQGGDESNIMIIMYNPDPMVTYHDIDYTIKSNFFDTVEGHFDFMIPKQDEEIFFYEFKTPYVDSNYMYRVNLEVNYRDQYHTWRKISQNATLTIKPIPFTHDLQIFHTVPKILNSSQVATIKVEVKNVGMGRLDDIKIEDNIEGLHKTYGNTFRRIPRLEKDKKESAYLYKVMSTNETPNATVTTGVTYVKGHDKFRIQKVSSFNVKLPPTPAEIIAAEEAKKQQEANKKEEQVEKKEPAPPKEPVKKTTRFGSMWNGVKGFFGKLFGKK